MSCGKDDPVRPVFCEHYKSLSEICIPENKLHESDHLRVPSITPYIPRRPSQDPSVRRVALSDLLMPERTIVTTCDACSSAVLKRISMSGG